MDSHWGTPNHRKRKRRRGASRPALSAQLFFDSRLKGDVGLLSEDLFAELFPQRIVVDESALDASKNPTCYLAITPHLPDSLFVPDTAPWTTLAVRRPSEQHASKQHARSTLHLPASSNSVQGIVSALQKASPHKPLTNLQQGVEIQVLDVAPLALDSVAVSLDFAALARLEAAHNEYKHSTSGRRGSRPRSRSGSANGGYGAGIMNGASVNSADDAAGKWESTIREALSGPKIVHAGDLVPLPYTCHPITHAPPPLVHVELCEPVAQGLLSARTKIVVLDSSRSKRTALPIQSPILPNGINEEDEDTSNEQFYSAAEEKTDGPSSRRAARVRRQQSETEDSEDSTDDDLDMSEDEGDAIGLDLPMIPSHSSGVLSAFSSATPRPGQLAGNGVSSPGGTSVFSGFSTTSTIRGASAKGRLFETQGLYAHIEDDALHPRPTPEEDEEARVFIDTTSLTKIGCFSGDWVRLEAAPNGSFGAMASWGLSALDPENKNDHEWRVAKIYALPGQPTQRPKYAIDRKGNRSSSFALSLFDTPSLKAYLSPLLLANLGSPAIVRLSPLAPPPPPPRNLGRGPLPKSRQPATIFPPTAKEVTFLKLLTPLATERNLDTSLFNGIGRFFKSRQRVVKAGDVLGISIDGDLGKAMYQSAPADEDVDQGELLENGDLTKETGSRKVVWFKIGSVSVEPARDDAEQDEEISWGGIALVDPATTRMAQSGSERGKLPDCLHSSWPYYLGAKRLPSRAEEVLTRESIRSPPKLKVPLLRRRLRELISAAVSPQAIHLGLPPMAILLTSTQRHIGKASVVAAACLDLGLHTFNIDANDIITEGGGGGGDTKTAGLLEARAERGLTCGPEYTALLIRHVEALTAERMVSTLKQILSASRVFVATTTDTENVPEGIRSLFTHEIEVHAPDEGEREGLLRDIVQNSDVPVSADVDLSSVAVKTAALVAGDLVDVVERALVARRDRLEKLALTSNVGAGPSDFRVTVRDIQIAGGNSSRCITKADFDVAVDAARKNFADAIGAPKIPSVGWDDVGGLTNVKDAVMETIQLPLERPELFAKGMKKRSGILFYGPPGTGKTLLAKAIATEFSLNFFSVKGPELLNMYIGESEANVRRVFQRARDARPCVVFFDELDSVAPKRGNQGDSGGVMDRIVSQLLAELDGMSSGEDSGGGVFVIGATNRPDLLDQALLRPGRFDKMLYLGVSDTHDKQQTILEALTRKFALHSSLSLHSIAAQLPFTYTGADLYALCSDAMLKAITRRATSVDTKVKILNTKRASSSPPLPAITVAYFFDHLAGPEDTDVVVESEDFENAMRELVPSVSVKELEHYRRVRQVFEKGEETQKEPHVALETVKQKANGKARAPFSYRADEDADMDDFVIRSESLNLNEQTNGNGVIGAPRHPITSSGSGSGAKGKGKAVANQMPQPQFDAHDFGFGKATDGDEELYSP